MNEPDGPSVWTACTTSIHTDFTAVGDGIRGFVTRQLLRPARAFPLAAKVTFAMDSVTKAPPPYSFEPLHHNLAFDRKIDLVLGKPTQISEEMQVKPLRKGDETIPNRLPGPPQITVTAVEM
jgi:hypothetical protein